MECPEFAMRAREANNLILMTAVTYGRYVPCGYCTLDSASRVNYRNITIVLKS